MRGVDPHRGSISVDSNLLVRFCVTVCGSQLLPLDCQTVQERGTWSFETSTAAANPTTRRHKPEDVNPLRHVAMLYRCGEYDL